MKKIFLLDAYALIYRAYYAFINAPRINSKGRNTSAILGFVNTLEEVLKKEKPDYIAVAFDPAGPTFRHEAFPEYKAQREATPEDIRSSVPDIKNIIRAYNIPILEVPGFEADDVIGTAALEAAKKGLDAYMMTPDKDYCQLVGEHVSMCKPGKNGEFEKLGPAEVMTKYGIDSPLQIIDLLGLMGDTADNVPGCPGVGEKTAVKLIQQFGGIDSLLQRTDELKGALKKKVEENVEQIKFSKFLVTIKTDVPLPLDFEELKLTEPDMAKLREIFEELEFRTLLNRLEKNRSNESKKEPMMADMFAVNVPDSSKTENNSKIEDLKSTPHKYYLVENENEIKGLCDKLLTTDEFCLDTETTGLDVMTANLVGLSFSYTEHEAFYVPVPQNREKAMKILNLLRPAYESETIAKVGQNLKFDLSILKSYGIELQGKMFDTMIAHYLLQPELRHNMDYLAEIYLNYRTVHIEELIGEKGKNQKNMGDLSPTDIYEYASEDADITLQLKNKLSAELAKTGIEKLFYEMEMPLMPVLAEMERNGVSISTEALAETQQLFNERMHKLEKEIFELCGHSFMLTSPRQVGEVLFDELKISEKPKKTKTGQYVTSEEVLESLKNAHPVVEKILDHRGLKKLLSTYIEALPKLINPATGHIHTSFNQTVTATGRLSSSNPNLQNIPVRGEDGREIRKAFIPEPGCLFFSADYSQIELRIMAHLSGDEALIQAFRDGEDIHAATAAKVFKKNIDEVTRDERRKAKTANFGIIYGISVFGLAERMEVSRGEAKELIDNYFLTYPAVKKYMDKSINVAREQGYIETIFGRRRYLPDINSRNSVVRGYAERNAINAPIQGTAADIIKLAMIRISQRMKEENVRSKMILQVHDELNFSVFPEEKELMERLVIEEMNNACQLKVPLQADCGWGQNWLEAH